MRPRRRADDDGQTALLIVGFFAVAVLLVGVVVDASAAYLQRQSLNALADGAAIAAADGVQGEQVYTEGLGQYADIDPLMAESYVRDYLAQTGAAQRFPGLTVRVEPVGTSVTVRVAAPLDLPIPPPGFADRTVVTGAASAVVVVR
ncbi:MAG: pilus assembly protein TadG-related protein [Actinomycetota bacterium]|nr:pilus assembly protein TadG-related protein [Actinomycetota bacterium]